MTRTIKQSRQTSVLSAVSEYAWKSIAIVYILFACLCVECCRSIAIDFPSHSVKNNYKDIFDKKTEARIGDRVLRLRRKSAKSAFGDDAEKPKLYGFRIDDSSVVVEIEPDGSLSIEPKKTIKLRLFGRFLNRITSVRLALSDSSCEKAQITINNLKNLDNKGRHFSFEATLNDNNKLYHFCLCTDERKVNDEQSDFEASNGSSLTESNRSSPGICRHQGASPLTVLKTKYPEKHYFLPLYLQISIIVCLMVLSGLFSGLNLGLMSLDKTELKILLKVGDVRERKYAKKIYPIRKSGNYLLCTLLLGNVVVNSAISILFDDLTNGAMALIFSSLGIVVFGEIVPQAICSRYGLAVGARTSMVTRFFMLFTFPLSWPISKILDKTLGEEVRQIYSRERLLELIRLSNDEQAANLGNCQEVQIVTGALELSTKTVGDVMTPINDVFMLSSDVILDPKGVSEIVKSGFTRIPVYDPEDRDIIVNMLNVKDLALLDPEDRIPLRTICQFYHHPVRFVMEDAPLGVMLEEFKKGHYHLAIVQKINNTGEADPVYKPVGLITLEDIIEEIIQSEIRDEFDIIRDSRLKRLKRRETNFVIAAAAVAARSTNTPMNISINPSDVSIFFNQSLDACDVSPQLTLAAYQYLSTTLDAFRTGFISENVLQRLIRQNVLRKKLSDPSPELFVKGRECNYFVLILEGKCSITVGESDLLFEAGPFCYFGYELLVRITRDIVARRGSAVVPTSTSTSQVAPPLSSVGGEGAAPLVRGNTVTSATLTTNDYHSLSSTGIGGVVTAPGTQSPLDVAGKHFTFTPDFTLRCDRQDVVYLKISASIYTKAYRATLIELGLGVDQPTAATTANGALRSSMSQDGGGSAPGSPANRRRRFVNTSPSLSIDDIRSRAFTKDDTPLGTMQTLVEDDPCKITADGEISAPPAGGRESVRNRAAVGVGSINSLDFRCESITIKEEETEDLLLQNR